MISTAVVHGALFPHPQENVTDQSDVKKAGHIFKQATQCALRQCSLQCSVSKGGGRDNKQNIKQVNRKLRTFCYYDCNYDCLWLAILHSLVIIHPMLTSLHLFHLLYHQTPTKHNGFRSLYNPHHSLITNTGHYCNEPQKQITEPHDRPFHSSQRPQQILSSSLLTDLPHTALQLIYLLELTKG